MGDSVPQLRLTGNFREGLKIWITSSTLYMGFSSKIQTWIKLVPTFTLMWSYLFALSLRKQLLLFAERKRTVWESSCVMCGCLAPTCFTRGPAKLSAGVHISGLFLHPATQRPPDVTAPFENMADEWMEGEDGVVVVRWQEISGSNINTHPVACLHSRTLLASAGLWHACGN